MCVCGCVYEGENATQKKSRLRQCQNRQLGSLKRHFNWQHFTHQFVFFSSPFDTFAFVIEIVVFRNISIDCCLEINKFSALLLFSFCQNQNNIIHFYKQYRFDSTTDALTPMILNIQMFYLQQIENEKEQMRIEKSILQMRIKTESESEKASERTRMGKRPKCECRQVCMNVKVSLNIVNTLHFHSDIHSFIVGFSHLSIVTRHISQRKPHGFFF